MPDTRKRKSPKSRKQTKKSPKIKSTNASAQKPKLSLPRTLEQYRELPVEKQDQLNRAAQVITKMRVEKLSLRRAASELSIDPRIVKQLGKSALRKKRDGKYVARNSDTMLRVLVVPTADGLGEIAVRRSKDASLVAQYNDALQKFLRTGDTRKLAKFRNKKLKDASGNTVVFLTDTKELIRQGSAGVFSFESLYARSV
jgi:hypothetical protein